jgi:HD superfamily phosphohydrolase
MFTNILPTCYRPDCQNAPTTRYGKFCSEECLIAYNKTRVCTVCKNKLRCSSPLNDKFILETCDDIKCMVSHTKFIKIALKQVNFDKKTLLNDLANSKDKAQHYKNRYYELKDESHMIVKQSMNENARLNKKIEELEIKLKEEAHRRETAESDLLNEYKESRKRERVESAPNPFMDERYFSKPNYYFFIRSLRLLFY